MNKVSVLAQISLVILLLSAQFGCYKDNKEAMYPDTNCDTTSVTWSGNIQSIVNSSCALGSCHDASSASGGYNLSTYAGVKSMVNNGRFLDVISTGSMPKNAAQLEVCAINKVRRWINQGALEN